MSGKTSGLGAAISVDDASGSAQVISNDISDFTLATPRAEQDITGVDKYAHERLLLLADGTVALKGVFNAAANMSHAVLSSVPSTSVTRTVLITPTAVSTPNLSMEMLFSSYDLARAAG
ncbi:MAG: hypothetical protein ACRDVE_02495, partial [Actinocrinis sp.]